MVGTCVTYARRPTPSKHKKMGQNGQSMTQSKGIGTMDRRMLRVNRVKLPG